MKLSDRRLRDALIIELFCSGQTMQKAGSAFGVKHQTVLGILKRNGVSSSEGGRAKRMRLFGPRRGHRKRRCEKRLEARAVALQCTVEQLLQIKETARQFPHKRSPRLAFSGQRRQALVRMVQWDLSFGEWWEIWHSSGHWGQRGIRRGEYVMCRKNDEGPYAVGNVFIDTTSSNVQQMKDRNKWLLAEAKRLFGLGSARIT